MAGVSRVDPIYLSLECVPTFEEYKELRPDQPRRIYNVDKEARSPDDLYNHLDHNAVSEALGTICGQIQDAISERKGKGKSEEVDMLYQEAQRLRTVAQTSSAMVSVIGPMGQGKSTAINGILNREICIANANGSSVTQVPTIYEYLESVTDENQAIIATVHFKSPEIIDHTTKTFYKHVKEWHFPEDTDEDEGPEDEEPKNDLYKELNFRKANGYMDNLAKAADHQLSTDAYTTKKSLAEPKKFGYVEKCIALAQAAIRRCSSGSERIHTFVAVDYKEYQNAADRFLNGPFTPLVDHITVAMKAIVLKDGAKIIDLPGSGSSDELCCQAMEYNVRADMYLIVGSVTCMQYDGKLRPAIKHALSRAANGLQNICIVATCIDDCPNETVEQELEVTKNAYLLQIRDQRKIAESLEEDDAVEEYVEYLTRLAKRAIILQRNMDTRAHFDRLFPNKHVPLVCTAAPLFLKHTKKAKRRDTPMVLDAEESGIPELRRRIRKLGSMDLNNDTLRYIQYDVYAFLRKLQLLARQDVVKVDTRAAAIKAELSATLRNGLFDKIQHTYQELAEALHVALQSARNHDPSEEQFMEHTRSFQSYPNSDTNNIVLQPIAIVMNQMVTKKSTVSEDPLEQ